MLDYGADARFAEHFGRICRRVYVGESWEYCEDRIQSTWGLIRDDMAWEDAHPRVKKGWDTGPVEDSFSELT